MTTKQQPLITAEQLAKQMHDPNLIILDATISVPGGSQNGSLKKSIIPGALPFNVDSDFSDADAPFPHTMLGAETFASKVTALGIDNESHVVIYDDIGLFSAPRAWWMFRAMGHDKVSLLNGGLPAWQAAGKVCANEYAKAKQVGNFKAQYNPAWFVAMPEVEKAIANGDATIIDARSADRFHSRVAEPRPEIRRGNIPRSLNLPFDKVLQNSGYKTPAAIEEEFKTLNLNKDQPLYLYCGSGVTACIDAVAALLCGFERVSVYDGSWCEWATCKPE